MTKLYLGWILLQRGRDGWYLGNRVPSSLKDKYICSWFEGAKVKRVTFLTVDQAVKFFEDQHGHVRLEETPLGVRVFRELK